MTRVTGRMALALTLFLPLTGCEILLISPTLPGIMPFVGRPLTGKIMDAVTGLPLGNATVTAGLLATAKTDPDGGFKLYGNIGGQGIAIARAGYTSLSYVTSGPLADGQTFFLPPLFPSTGLPSAKHVTLQGTVHYNGAPITPAGGAVFGGLASAVTNAGIFSMPIRELLPGAVYSTVLAGGILQGGPIVSQTGQSSADFYFDSFGYRFVDIPFADKPDQTPLQLSPIETNAVPFQSMSVSYSGAAAFNQVQTDVIMDFGLMGAVPVARQSRSNQSIKVPAVAGLKYAIEGRASDASGKLTSKVSITTNTLGAVSFKLLPPPTVTGPVSGTEGVGANPPFSWDPVPDAQSYLVEVFEGTQTSATLKWKGYTSQTSIAFPTFPDWDMNGGALLPGISYSWTIRAYKATVESLGKSLTAPPPSKPYRSNLYESAASGMTFKR